MSERDCKGCGGSGCEDASNPATPWEPCLVCLGSGRVKDGPYRADALVDAETLRLNAGTTREGDALWLASAWGNEWLQNRTTCAPVMAAQAAFRAIPSLREE